MPRSLSALMMILLSLVGLATVAAQAADGDERALTASEFLAIARRPPLVDSWAKMAGTVMHSTGGRTRQIPIEFRARFSPARILAKVELDGGERFAVSQVFADGMAGTSVLQEQEAEPGAHSLNGLGMRPGDLTLSFLYWNLVEELEPETVKMQKCRVFRLQHPTAPEMAEVAISTEFFFPLRVEWFASGEKDANRKLEFTNFKRKGDIWIINEALLSAKGWKTRVRFTKVDVEVIDADRPEPQDLFQLAE